VIILDENHLMMIEPNMSATDPIQDDLTNLARIVFDKSRPNNICYRGVHTCICGINSDNRNWILLNGVITNSLLVHYVECHRSEIPESELEKLHQAVQDVWNLRL